MDKTYKSINASLIFILILNFIVCGFKIIMGYITRSASMAADGFHSLSDGISNIIGIIGIWLSSRPIDEEHPYGHKKFETFTTIFISFLLFAVSFEVIDNAITRFKNPEIVPVVTSGSFIVMAATLLVNIWIVWYETRKGRQLKSDFLMSDAKHTASDIYVSLSVMGSLAAVKLGFAFIDVIVSIVIALIILKAAAEILIHSANILCDASPIKPDRIMVLANSVDGVLECHKVRARGREDDIHVDLHVWVNSDMSVKEGHTLCHEIENKIKEELTGVSEVIVHIEPYGAVDNMYGDNISA